MGIGFLVPAFLIGLAALAVPVFLHLLNKERKGVIAFPSLMFLERVQYREIRRQTIRHPLLLALRCLALALLAAAFARPFFDRDPALAADAGSARELVVLLDRSYSMGHGTRWARARDATRRELAGLGPADHASVVAFDDRATALGGPETPPEALGAALDTLAPADRSTRLGPALAAARELLAASARPRREVVIVSDLQRLAWDGREDGRLPADAAVRLVDLSDSAAANALVSGVELAREWQGDRQRVTVVARVVNRGGTALRSRPVSLELQGRTVETRTVDIPANGAATVRFAAAALPAGVTRAVVRLAPDALPKDDAYHFTLSRDQALRVLVVVSPDAPARRSLYLRRALALGDRPPFQADVRELPAVTADLLSGYDVVVLNDAPFPGGAAGRRLAERVRAGMGLVAVLGDRSDPRRWPADGAALLPADAGAVTDRSTDNGGRLGTVDRSHPVFTPFAGARSGDFSATRFLRYRPLALRDSADGLAQLDDGSVLLAERAAGRGTVLAWGTTLDDFWSDFALQPVYLPFVHGLVRRAAGYDPEPIARTVGQLVALQAGTDDSPPVATVVAPSGGRERRAAATPGADASRATTPGARAALELGEAGFYELLAENGTVTRVLAANADRAESELEAWDPTELAATLVSRDSLATAGATGAPTAAEREGRQRVWWLLLVAAFAVLLVETALGNRISRRPAVAAAG